MTLPPDLSVRPLEASDDAALVALARACDETYLEWAPAGWSIPDVPPGWAERLIGPDRWSLAAFDGGGRGRGRLVATVAFRPARRLRPCVCPWSSARVCSWPVPAASRRR